MENQKKLIIRVEVDIPKSVEDARAFIRPFTLFFQVIGYMIARRVPSHTAKRKTAAYTAKNGAFTQQNKEDFVSKSRGVGATIDDDMMHSSTLVKCGNPECNEIFEYQKRGNQYKKYCSAACKDVVNNARKMNYQHQN